MNEITVKGIFIAIVGIVLGIGVYSQLQKKTKVIQFTSEAVPQYFAGGSRHRTPFVTFKLRNSSTPLADGETISFSEAGIYNDAKTNKAEIRLDQCPIAMIKGSIRVTDGEDPYLMDFETTSWKWCE